MKVWPLKLDLDRYAPLAFVDRTMTRKLIGQFMGQPFSREWGKIEVYSPKEWEERGLTDQERTAIKELKEGRPLGDFAWLAGAEGAVVMSHEAMETMQSLLETSVEVLPLRYGEERLHLVNVLNVVDCLDQDKSEVKRLSNGAILWIITPVFKEELLEGVSIFKLPQPKNPIFVSDLFRQTVEENGLKGLVW